MEVDEIQQVCKFQRIASNGSATTDNSSNPNKLATTQKVNHHYFDEDGGAGDSAAARICGWPSSRIVRVSRASGGKDRHSKVLTSKGLRDRRVRLSVTTAIQFYDLQDRLGYDQPSKAVEWLIKAASSSISELPSLDPSFPAAVDHRYHHRKQLSDDKIVPAGKDTDFEDPNFQQNNNISVSKSSACSSTSETSKGSGLSLSRSENRMKARERAREMAAKKEKEKEMEMTTSSMKGISQNSSFTDLLTGNNNSNPANSTPPDSRIHWTTPMDYFFNRPPQLPQFNISAGENHPHHHFSFLQENFSPANGGGGGGESYNLNFSIASSSSGGGFATGFNRGTLQSNLESVLPHQHVQRFQSSSMVDGSTSTNFPLFMGQSIGSTAPENFPAAGYDSQRLQLYGGADGGRHKEKSKN